MSKERKSADLRELLGLETLILVNKMADSDADSTHSMWNTRQLVAADNKINAKFNAKG